MCCGGTPTDPRDNRWHDCSGVEVPSYMWLANKLGNEVSTYNTSLLLILNNVAAGSVEV